MAEFIKVLSNVKVIKCYKGGIPDVRRETWSETFPSIDLFVRPGLIRIYADLPGISPEEVSVYIYENYIVIEGIKK